MSLVRFTEKYRVWIGVTMIAGCAFFPGAGFAASQNVLLIIADDYGADSSSLYNSNASASLPPTPNIESLARNGVLFRNGYANPVCSPSRACLITGRHGFRTGIGDVITGPGSVVLSASEFTLPEAFSANAALGYQLAQFGKWHLAMGPNTPNSIGGWPHFAGSLPGALVDYSDWTKTVNGISTANYTNYATTDVVNDAVAWIQARGTQPWFAWVAFNAPHTPLHKPPSSLCPHYATLPGTQLDISRRPRLYFEAMVEAMDTEIGQLLGAVNRTNTHILFLGDNGTTGNVIQPPYPSTRAKDTLYEGGIKVPFIISGPMVNQPGRTNDTPVHAVDLFATVLELAGINVASTVPAGVTIDSQSLLPALTNTATLDRCSFSEKFGTNTPSPDGRALRNAQFKLLRFDDGREEFYDLMADPIESTNLLAGTLTDLQRVHYYSLEMKLGSFQTKVAAPMIAQVARSGETMAISVPLTSGITYGLWRATMLDPLAWAPAPNAIVTTNGTMVTLTDTQADGGSSFYRVSATSP
jgi:arylsulfatase A-like enzyme